MSGPAPIRFAIAGLGSAGTALIPPVVKNPAFNLAAAADTDERALARLTRDFPEALTFTSVEELTESDVADVVFVATPTHLHADHVRAAIAGGKHVVSEKPIATNLEDAGHMIEAAEAAGVIFMVGHSFGYETPIKEMRRIVKSGELGALKMMHNWYFTDWIYRPRNPEELDTDLGGGVTFRQGSHQFDIIRLIGGGRVRSVRAVTGRWDASRPTEGAHTVFLEFDDGTVATAVYSGYDRFRTAELGFAVGENGRDVDLSSYGSARKALGSTGGGESDLKREGRYGGSRNRGIAARPTPNHPFYGLTVVSCERGDIRQSPEGLMVYGSDRKQEIAITKGTSGRDNILTELRDAIVDHKRPVHDGHWGRANLEVCLAVLQSAREHKEIYLSHQTAVND
ncbi:MAG: Gfo/Idh/MocA family oxidoreductase [Hyphomicrobiales bacterium]|nr:Gfo/Idh/MocA family oxidoreductase [Hyphomicrobiales bacterium]